AARQSERAERADGIDEERDRQRREPDSRSEPGLQQAASRQHHDRTARNRRRSGRLRWCDWSGTRARRLGEMNVGRVVQIAGPVVDVEFTEALPAIYNALTVECRIQDEPVRLTLEVQQHLGDRWVRAISMTGTEGLKRGFDATDTGKPISM